MSAGRGTLRPWPAAHRLPIERHVIVRHEDGSFSFAEREVSPYHAGFAVYDFRRSYGSLRSRYRGLSAADVFDRAWAPVRFREQYRRATMLVFGFRRGDDERWEFARVRSETVEIVADLEFAPPLWRPMIAQYQGQCQLCKGRFLPGTPIFWNRYRGAVHATCGAVDSRFAV